MPKEFTSCVTDLKASGKKEETAYAICTANFKRTYGMTPQYAEQHPKEFNAAKKKHLANKSSEGGDIMKLADMNDVQMFAEISKVDHEKRMVYGYATTSALDSQDEEITKEATEMALKDYSNWRNLREMHQASAVGTVPVIEMTEKGAYVGAHVVDDSAWKKVENGVYKGFSIGGKRQEDEKYFNEKLQKRITRITKYKLNEISLVDRPANPEAIFNVAKRDDSEPEEKAVSEEIKKEVAVMDEIKKDESPPAELKIEKTVEVVAPPPEETVTLKKAEYDEFVKATEELKKLSEQSKVQADALAKREEVDAEILKRIEALAPKMKQVVQKSEEELARESEKERISKMSIGELAKASGWFKRE
jgi:phage head maturation protease